MNSRVEVKKACVLGLEFLRQAHDIAIYATSEQVPHPCFRWYFRKSTSILFCEMAKRQFVSEHLSWALPIKSRITEMIKKTFNFLVIDHM